MRLADALDQTATSTLRRVAAAHGLPLDDSTTRAELIQRIAERLSDDVYLSQQLQALSDVEREVLVSARMSSGELRGLLVDSEHPGTAEDLAERGWLFRVFAAGGPLRGEVLVVPDELLSVLPEAEAVTSPRADLAPPPEPRFTHPAFSLFALISALTRAGGQLEAEVRNWSQEPGDWDWAARWSFLQHLALGAGLLVHRADGVLSPAPGLARLLDDPSSLAERTWHAYLRDRSWSELHHAGLASADLEDAEVVDVLGLRRAIAEVVQELPEGGWLELENMSEWLRQAHPTFVREQLTPRGLVLLHSADWSQLELPLLRYFVLGPLYWLGQVAAARDGHLFARRRAHAAAPEACHWEGAAELVAPARVQLGTLLSAERYLVLRERGRVSRYHLVQTHVAAALGLGGSIAECRQLLERLTRAPLPVTVEGRLAAWEQRFGALDIRPAVVLEGRTAAELEAVLGDDAVRPFVRARLGPRVAEVAAADALELAAALRGLEYLPRIDAALRLAAEPRRAYAGLVDEQVLEFLLVSLVAFQMAWPERLAELEGSTALLERLERQFPPARLADLRAAAARLAGALANAPPVTPRKRPRRRKPKL